MRTNQGMRRGRPSIAAARSFAWLALYGAGTACSVYSASDLDATTSGGSSAGPKGGEPAASGSSSGGATSGGTAAQGASSGTGAANTAGDGGSSPSPSGGTAGDVGTAGDGGEGPVGPDECPDDPAKRAPGVCGCGIPDVATTELSGCQSLQAALVHRYDFEGSGTAVTDRAGTAHGTVVGATLSQLEGRGVVSLTGGSSGPYVDLPNKLISPLTSVTVEAWLTWRGGAAWQRVFDFGDSTATTPENNPASGKTYLFATPHSEDDVALASYSHEGNSDGQQLEATAAAPLAQTLSQLVVVANGAAHKLVLYINGEKISEQGWTGSLSKINDVNVWIGRSQYTQDPELNAVVHDFRIYDAALTDAQVATAYLGGTDPPFFVEAPAATSTQ